MSLDEGNKQLGSWRPKSVVKSVIRNPKENRPKLPKPKVHALKVNTWLLGMTRVVSASGGSPSKSESLVKDDSRLTVAAKKQRVRKSKPCSIGGGRVHGAGGDARPRGGGQQLNGSTPSLLLQSFSCIKSYQRKK